MSTPIERLRALHKPCVMPCFDHAWVGDRQHCAGPHCLATWPCDTVAALDALEYELDLAREAYDMAMDAEREMQTRIDALEAGLHSLLDARPTRGQLTARLDAATVLIRQAMGERHYSIRPNTGDSETRCGSPIGTSIDTCPDCAPYREWLAGKEGEGQ